jgi:hypothetical protein
VVKNSSLGDLRFTKALLYEPSQVGAGVDFTAPSASFCKYFRYVLNLLRLFAANCLGRRLIAES